MAAKRPLITIIIIAAIVTIAALQYGRFIELTSRQEKLDDLKFIKSYVELSLAKDEIDELDSLESIFDSLFMVNETDSLWMREFLRKIGDDTDKRQRIWKAILDTLNAGRGKHRR